MILSGGSSNRLGQVLLLGGAGVAIDLLALLPVDGMARIYVARGAGVVASAILLAMALRMPASTRAIWLTFWGYQTLTVVADIVYDVQRVTMEEPPFPGPADGLYFLTYAFAFVGLAMLTARISARRNLEAGIDSAVIALALLALVGYFIILPIIGSYEEMGIEVLASIGYPLVDV